MTNIISVSLSNDYLGVFFEIYSLSIASDLILLSFSLLVVLPVPVCTDSCSFSGSLPVRGLDLLDSLDLLEALVWGLD